MDLGLGVSTNSSSEASERNYLFVFKHIVHILDRFFQSESLHGTSGFKGVLEVSAKISNSRLGSYKLSKMRLKTREREDIHLVGSAGCLEYLTIVGNLYLFIK
jgi:hypothetical protein